MRDLEIWRRLHGGAATAADLAEVATLTLSRRCAYIGLIAPLVEHTDPVMRAAALRALAGARGYDGVCAIVRRLDDEDAGVRAAALDALRDTARDAPVRYAHALFHERVDVRQGALSDELPTALAELAMYLRSDPACAELAAQRARWPSNSLELGFSLYASGHVVAGELLTLLASQSGGEIGAYLARSRRRDNTLLTAYLEAAAEATSAIPSPPGGDDVDLWVRALAETGAPAKHLDHFLETVTGRTMDKQIVRRAAVAVLGRLADTPGDAALWGACVVLEPRMLSLPAFPAAQVRAAIDAIFRYKWPRKPNQAQVERLLKLPLVRDDLALAAAVAGYVRTDRLRALSSVHRDEGVIRRLVASDHGWVEICRLPPDSSARELTWLRGVEAIDYKRYITLAGIALGVLSGSRAGMFVETLPERHRGPVFLAALIAQADAAPERLQATARLVGARIGVKALTALLAELLPSKHAEKLVIAVAREVADKRLASAVAELSVRHVVRFVELADADPLPRDRELAVAQILLDRRVTEVRAWCDQVQTAPSAPDVPAAPLVRARRELTTVERDKISTAPDSALDTALAPALGGAVTGLCRALDHRTAKPQVWAAAALMACADPLEDVARSLDRFWDFSAGFDVAVDNAMGSMARVVELPPLAQARLWRWETQLIRFLDWVDSAGGVLRALELTETLRGRAARETLWLAISEGVMLMRYRQMPRFRNHASLELAVYAGERIGATYGRHAARIVVALVESGTVPLASIRNVVLDRIAEADGEGRAYISRLLRLEGVPEAPPVANDAPMATVEEIRGSTDIEQLAAWCFDVRSTIVQEAALVLVALGAPGQLRLAEVLAAGPPAPLPILATLVLWDHGPAIEQLRALVDAPGVEPAWQFHIALALVHRGDRDALPRAFAAVRALTTLWYFRRADWDALVDASGDVLACALALADAPHHHAYQRAIQTLLSLTRPTPVVREALTRFLEVDSSRPLALRLSVARYLTRHFHDPVGLPLLIEDACDEPNASGHEVLADVPAAEQALLLRAAADAALIGGATACSEKRLWWLQQYARGHKLVTAELTAEIDLRILERGMSAPIRRLAAQVAIGAAVKHTRLRRVAEVFAWGVRRGVELTGRLFKMHLTSKEKDFGHTRLDGNHIFVSPLPMLRAEAHGQDIVEGLVLHEIGHHLYHRSEDAQKLWKQAHAEGIGHFLNLIADEHLERNLRALDPSYGDRLKRLGAYAFNHAPQEIKLSVLCESLGAATARALIAADLEVAFDDASVRLRRGTVLGELDRTGHPLARFSRALRMGLGNRANDPLIAQALAMCGKDLRSLDMRGLYDLTRQLVELFGGRVELAKCFGGPEGLVFGDRDDDVFGAGIDDDILQREIERILEPRSGTGKPGPRDRLCINVNPGTDFNTITKIVRVQGNQEQHRAHVTQVKRHSARLRMYLDELGLRWQPVRARTQGRALDRTRLRALVTRNDPRILIARNPVRKTDLFLGTIVDCSGSMSARDNIERAKRFAILVAEAVRELQGVEARFFGFTDSVIYDAGDKHDCNVVAFEANGGNNDAAALYHAANVALSSPQRAKVLIMISDGLPTECSVAALKNLVTDLTKRRGIVCAQVGVIDLKEICFPHYVLIDDDQLDTAVAKFGRMIAELARRSLAS